MKNRVYIKKKRQTTETVSWLYLGQFILEFSHLAVEDEIWFTIESSVGSNKNI